MSAHFIINLITWIIISNSFYVCILFVFYIYIKKNLPPAKVDGKFIYLLTSIIIVKYVSRSSWSCHLIISLLLRPSILTPHSRTLLAWVPYSTWQTTSHVIVKQQAKLLSKFLLPTDAHENCFKWSIKIYMKTSPTCFGVITIIRERTIWTC